MSAANRSDLLRPLRALAAAAGFAALAAGVALLVLFEVAHNGNVVENGPVELAQIALLALASLAYALRARAAILVPPITRIAYSSATAQQPVNPSSSPTIA